MQRGWENKQTLLILGIVLVALVLFSDVSTTGQAFGRSSLRSWGPSYKGPFGGSSYSSPTSTPVSKAVTIVSVKCEDPDENFVVKNNQGQVIMGGGILAAMPVKVTTTYSDGKTSAATFSDRCVSTRSVEENICQGNAAVKVVIECPSKASECLDGQCIVDQQPSTTQTTPQAPSPQQTQTGQQPPTTQQQTGGARPSWGWGSGAAQLPIKFYLFGKCAPIDDAAQAKKGVAITLSMQAIRGSEVLSTSPLGTPTKVFNSCSGAAPMAFPATVDCSRPETKIEIAQQTPETINNAKTQAVAALARQTTGQAPCNGPCLQGLGCTR